MSFGRLGRTPAAAPMSDINMTPLIDVMLVLLVIFMVAAPLLVSSVPLDLPKTDGATASGAPAFVEVSIDRSGSVYVDAVALGPEALARRLEQTARANAAAEVRLRADTAVPYGRVVEVMGLAQKVGLNHIGFVADPAQSTTP